MTHDDKPGRDRDEAEAAKEHLVQGIGLLFRAAKEAASSLKKEVDRVDGGGITHAIDDAGRELVRAATNVVGRIGEEIQKLDPQPRRTPPPPAWTPEDRPTTWGAAPSWPTTREEYERKYGKIDGDWPKSPEEYKKRFGEEPGGKPKGPTPDDPGFSIAGEDEKPR